MTLIADIKASRGGFHLDVQLDVGTSEVVAVVGPNGAGKSTLLRALAGLTRMSGGRIEIDGTVLDDTANGVHVPVERRPVGVVFQDLLLFPHLTALENVAFGLRCRRVPRTEARRQAMEWLGKVGLADYAGHRPSQLSGGQAQRVALSRALATRPKLLLMDEPLSALDAGTRAEVRRDLKNGLADFGGVQLIVTHDPAEAMALADRLVVVEQGKIVQIGNRTDITVRPRSAYVATFAGVNLFRGTASGHEVKLRGGRCLVVPDACEGDVFATVHPRAITLHRLPPDGSASNVWCGKVASIDESGETVRILVDCDHPVVAEITVHALTKLGIATGSEVWASAKATELRTYPA
jgi:molybdate transport system ATP-binding protein